MYPRRVFDIDHCKFNLARPSRTFIGNSFTPLLCLTTPNSASIRKPRVRRSLTPLWRHVLDGVNTSIVDSPDPSCCRRGLLVTKNFSKVCVWQHSVKKKAWLLLSHKLPQFLLSSRLTRAVHWPLPVRFIWRWLPGCLNILIVPVVSTDCELHIWFRAGDGS